MKTYTLLFAAMLLASLSQGFAQNKPHVSLDFGSDNLTKGQAADTVGTGHIVPSILSEKARIGPVSIGTDLGQASILGTANISLRYSPNKFWNAKASTSVNPFSYRTKGDFESRRQNEVKVRSLSFELSLQRMFPDLFGKRTASEKGDRGYPFIETGAIVKEYDNGGVRGVPFLWDNESGLAFGLTLKAGWIYPLSESLFLETGIGLYSGVKSYTTYSCPFCGEVTSTGIKTFLVPSHVNISLVRVL